MILTTAALWAPARMTSSMCPSSSQPMYSDARPSSGSVAITVYATADMGGMIPDAAFWKIGKGVPPPSALQDRPDGPAAFAGQYTAPASVTRQRMGPLSSPTHREQDGPEVIARLLAAAAKGDESAWRELISRYGRRVYALAKSRCRRADVAEEVTQSVFVTIAAKLGRGGYSEQGRFESWLFRVAMNRVRDELRRAGRQAAPTDPASLVHAPAMIDDPRARAGEGRAPAGELAALRGAMESLSEADREVVELRHHAGLSFKQMADLLGEPIGTLLARHHRALRKLKQLIGDRAGGVRGDAEEPEGVER